jgi:sarcosine oxidase
MMDGMRVAVIGAGVVGLAATAELLERDVEVTCYERRRPMAERSAGESRIFRLAHGDPALVELAGQSRRLFARWEELAGEELIDQVGTVVSGTGASVWSEAMTAVGAEHYDVGPDSDLLRLPTAKLPELSVVDPAGGVLRVDRIGAFLTSRCRSAVRAEHVFGLEEGPGGVLVHASGSLETYDAVVICAGAGTVPLAAQVGLYPPAALYHHARFTFPTRPSAPPRMQCWISANDDGHFGSYQHSNAPGQWAVGLHVDPATVRWEVGAEAATELMRKLTRAYAEEVLDAVEPDIAGQLYCVDNPELGDGAVFLRNGRALAVYGENLFKFAPLLGQRLAESALDGSLPGRFGQD